MLKLYDWLWEASFGRLATEGQRTLFQRKSANGRQNLAIEPYILWTRSLRQGEHGGLRDPDEHAVTLQKARERFQYAAQQTALHTQGS